jgi:hypothetical protein
VCRRDRLHDRQPEAKSVAGCRPACLPALEWLQQPVNVARRDLRTGKPSIVSASSLRSSAGDPPADHHLEAATGPAERRQGDLAAAI